MVAVFVDVLREEKREALRKAVAVCISTDDKSPWRDVSYQACLQDGSVCRGVVRVVFTNDDLDKDKVESDKSVAMAESIVSAWTDLCTPRGGTLDRELLQHILSITFAWSSDRCPAAMKAARALRQHCPRLCFINKDPCHVIRTVTSLVESSFGKAEEVLFNDKTSVVPTITNSAEWSLEEFNISTFFKRKSKFLWLEKLVLEKPEFSGAMKVAVRHFQWAKTRWESSAGPRRRLCHLLIPTALLLAVAASDARASPEEQKRLVSRLDALRPQLWLELGIAADWREEFISLIRRLEPEGYDPACLEADVREWFRRQTQLFQDGRILDELPDEEGSEQSCTFHVVRNAMQCPPLYVGGRVFHMWSKERGDKQVFQGVLQNMSNLVEAAKARVDSELLNTMQTDWQVFSLRSWTRSRNQSVEEQRTFDSVLRHRLGRLLRSLALSVRDGTEQFFRVAPILAEKFEEKMDNRVLWHRVFEEATVRTAGDVSVLRILVGAYLANMAGSTGRERELAQIKALADNHTNCSADLASAIHEIRMDGPQDESGLAVRYAAQLRKSCEDAVEESVEPGGTRGERRGCRPGSERALILSQQQGRAQLADGKGRCNGLLGFKKDDLLVPRGKRKEKYLLSDVLAQFRKTTENRQKEKLARHGNIRAGANPYPLGSLRLGRLFDGPGDEGQTTIRLGGSGRQVRTYNLSKVGA
ncbi:unnamed protein product, partial [Durusdinium trenchii]